MAAKKFVCKVCGYVHEGSSAPSVCPLCKAAASEFEAVKENKKKGINTNSDIYAIFYSVVLVVIVAFLLAGVSSALSPMQQANIELDKKKQILASLNIKDQQDPAAKYEEVFKGNEASLREYIINSKGEVLETTGGFAVANDKISDDKLPLYIAKLKDGSTKYIIPMTGNGLWGGIWGYMALNDDMNTIYGVYFSHASETPGLGAEIAGDKFQGSFKDKKVMADGEIALTVAKKIDSKSDTQVQAVSGATITCNGVNAMLQTKLNQYKAFLVNNSNPEQEAASSECCPGKDKSAEDNACEKPCQAAAEAKVEEGTVESPVAEQAENGNNNVEPAAVEGANK